ncbi:MAG: RNA 2'-phosphotransferase [Ruminococcus flavefaciens]|nr:RNA 2'-phosphotransferase [Ruminococcus flavefaciens]
MSENLTKISRFLSLILRHKPEVIGIELDKKGWADVSELITGVNKTGEYFLDMKTLERIVSTDEKKRYSFTPDKKKIRANQGHSVKVDVELKECQPPELLWHGTGEKYVDSINSEGLKPKGRLYVHLSADVETALKVGGRHGKPVVYKIMSGEMYRQGYVFYLSENGVWLADFIPTDFMEIQET